MRAGLPMLALILAACCGHAQETRHSHAADAMIAAAKTREERDELTRVRDDVDNAAQKRIRELDAEIERLERENAELRR